MSIYSPLLLRADRPVDRWTIVIVRRVVDVATSLDRKFLLVGAAARDLLLYHVYGLPLMRATRDLDFAFAFESWSEFESLTKELLQSDPCFRASTVAHRLIYSPAGRAAEIPVDIVPVGEVEGARHVVTWPRDGACMNMAGYREVLDSAKILDLGANCLLKVPSIPGLLVLKLFAWLDRGDENPKDAEDIGIIVKQYQHCDSLEAYYGQPDIEALVERYATFEASLSYVLGRDVAALCAPETRESLVSAYRPARIDALLVGAMHAQRGARADEIAVLLSAFFEGLTS